VIQKLFPCAYTSPLPVKSLNHAFTGAIPIDAVQNNDDRFPLLGSDRIWLVGKSLGDDFNPPGLLRVAYRYAPGEKYCC
jgi:hypothetical protein